MLKLNGGDETVLEREPKASPAERIGPPIPAGRRLRRRLARRLPLLVWVVGALAAAWLYLHGAPRSQAVASAEFSEVRVRCEASGRIERVAVRDGQSVRDGEVLATLESKDLDRRISRCREILDRLRAKAPGPQGGGSAEDDARIYELKLEELQADKEKHSIVARASGRVEGLTLRAGDWVTAGTDVGVIESGKPGRLTAYVSESRLPSLIRGTRTLLRPRGKNGAAVQGRVIRVSSRIEQVPDRVHHEIPSTPGWARAVTIELDRLSDFSPGEVYDVCFLR